MPTIALSARTYERLVEIRTGFETPDETIWRVLNIQPLPVGVIQPRIQNAVSGFELLKADLVDALQRKTSDKEIEIRPTGNSQIRARSNGRTPRHYALNRKAYGQGARKLGWVTQFSRGHGSLNTCLKLQVKDEVAQSAGVAELLGEWQKHGGPGHLLVEYSQDGWFEKPAWDIFISVGTTSYDQKAFEAIVPILVSLWTALNGTSGPSPTVISG